MLKAGTRIKGKWTGEVFQVEQTLGMGANGEVYLVRTANGRAAMKVCERSADIALEWALLEKLSQSSQVFPRPMLIDDEPPSTFFYVMEWVPGHPFHQVMPKLDIKCFSDAVEQVFTALAEVHATGHAFCDIKPENILISTSPRVRVRFVDVGGITQFNRSVRQFTPFYDRAFWGLGSRKAEATYDLAACALAIVLSISGTPPHVMVNRSPQERKFWLDKALKKFPLVQYTPLLEGAMEGQFTTALDLCEAWKRQPSVRRRMNHPMANAQARHVRAVHVPVHPGHAGSLPMPRRRKRKRDWTEWVMWVSLGTAATVTLTAWGTFLGWFGQ